MKITTDVLPIFRVRRSAGETRPVAFQGTGFVPAHDVFVTCWHCVSTPLAANEEYVALVDDGSAALRLRDIEQHAAGFDLALARIARGPQLGLVIPPYQYPAGVRVSAYGYPLTQTDWALGAEFPTLDLQPRYLEGYVARDFHHEQPGFGRTPTYELDMPAPEGLSGAPLIKRDSGELIGVVYGAADSYAIPDTASVNPDTGEPRPEIQRLVRFALAHSTPTVRNLAGAATGGRPLADLVNKA